MKKAICTFSAIICLMFSSNLSAQHAEAHKLDKQIELQLDSATHSMMMFILKQDTTYYVDAIMRADKSKDLVKHHRVPYIKRPVIILSHYRSFLK